MRYYSQRSDDYGNLKLGNSKLTMAGYGCLIASAATLFQIDPVDILKGKGCVTDAGLTVLLPVAQLGGGSYQGASQVAPAGWCIAMTDHYKDVGVPTHFFCVNKTLGLQIDPLDKSPAPEPLTYKVVEYRLFSGVKLDTTTPADWKAKAQEWAKVNQIITSGWDNPEQPMTQVRVAAALKNFADRFFNS